MTGSTLLAAAAPAVLAAAAAALALRPPDRGLRRLRAPRAPRAGPPPRLAPLLTGRPGSSPLAQRAAVAAAAGLAVTLVASRVAGVGLWAWLAWPVLVLVGTVLLGRLEPAAVQRRAERLVLEVPQALELMAACLAVGLPARRACALVAEAFDGPVAEDLRGVLRAVELGVPEPEAWQSLAAHPQFGPAAVEVSRAVESGTELVAPLREQAAAARERRRAVLQQRARAVGVRSVLPLMACFLPAFLLLGVVPSVVSAVLHAFAR